MSTRSPFDRPKPVPAPARAPSAPPASPFANRAPVPLQPAQAANIQPVLPTSPLARPAAPSATFAVPAVAYTVQDIDVVGKDTGLRSSALTDRVTKKMTLNRLGDLGQLLASTQLEVQNLDPGKIQKGGMFGWIQNRFIDLRKELITRFEHADGAFNQLSKGMMDHVAVLREWEKDDEEMYRENYEIFRSTVSDLGRIDMIVRNIQQALAAWPAPDPRDPEAMIKVQQKMEIEELLTRARIKQDNLLRLKQAAEMDGPNILAMKAASGKLIAKITSDVQDIIPRIKREIAKEIQRLDLRKATSAVNAFGSAANTILQKGAANTKESVLEANKAFQAPTISNETLDFMRNSLVEMTSGVHQIAIEAEKQRQDDAKSMEQKQQQLLQDLQSKGAI